MRSTAELSGLRVLGGKNGTRRIGKVFRAVFFPDDLRLAGFVVKRPDFLWMIKRRDCFLAWDSFHLVDGQVVASPGKESWDARSRERLGLDWDAALVLQGMSVFDATGEKVGSIDAVEYDMETGESVDLLISTSVGARALVGQIRVPVSDIKEYRDLMLIMREGASAPDAEGGLASVAGKQVAVVGNAVKDTLRSAGEKIDGLTEKVGKSVDKVSDVAEAGGRALGRQLGKRKGMFRAFKDEYDKASKG